MGQVSDLEGSSWSQGFLPLSEPLEVHGGEELDWELSVSGDGEHWIWRVDAHPA